MVPSVSDGTDAEPGDAAGAEARVAHLMLQRPAHLPRHRGCSVLGLWVPLKALTCRILQKDTPAGGVFMLVLGEGKQALSNFQ